MALLGQRASGTDLIKSVAVHARMERSGIRGSIDCSPDSGALCLHPGYMVGAWVMKPGTALSNLSPDFEGRSSLPQWRDYFTDSEYPCVKNCAIRWHLRTNVMRDGANFFIRALHKNTEKFYLANQ